MADIGRCSTPPVRIADQPTVKAVLHSLRGVLSSTCRLHGAQLYVLDGEGESLHVLEFDQESDAPAIKTGTKHFTHWRGGASA